jgi:hypothetical protein
VAANRFDTASGLSGASYYTFGGVGDGPSSEAAAAPQLIGPGASGAGVADIPPAIFSGFLGDGQDNLAGPPGSLSPFTSGQSDPNQAAVNGAGTVNLGPGGGGDSDPGTSGGDVAVFGILRSLPPNTNLAFGDDLSSAPPAPHGDTVVDFGDSSSARDPLAMDTAADGILRSIPVNGGQDTLITPSDSSTILGGGNPIGGGLFA